MKISQAFFLGIIQGLTEFLPISSSGHLILFQKLFGLSGDLLFFNLFLHLATLIAVVIVFRKQVADVIRHPFSPLGKRLIISIIPTVIIALALKKIVKNPSGIFLGICFLLTSGILFFSERFAKKKKSMFSLTDKTALIMGLVQGVAVLPGISRSGSTLATGLLCGKDRNDVADFSFLMSVPVILGGFVLELFDVFKYKSYLEFSFVPMLVGFISALAFGLLSLKVMLKCVKKLKLYYFSIYLVLISFVTFAFVS